MPRSKTYSGFPLTGANGVVPFDAHIVPVRDRAFGFISPSGAVADPTKPLCGAAADDLIDVAEPKPRRCCHVHDGIRCSTMVPAGLGATFKGKVACRKHEASLNRWMLERIPDLYPGERTVMV